MPNTPSNQDATVEMRVPKVESATAVDRPRKVGLVIGSSPSISDEAYERLRDRLQTASLLLGIGYAAFFAVRLLGLFNPVEGQHWLLFWLHLVVTIATLTVAWRLCSHCVHMLRHLRLGETIVFGGSAIFFAAVSFYTVADSIEKGYFAQVSGPWLLLIFTYALLIPNTWRRAAMVIVPLALLPVLITLAVHLTTAESVVATSSDSEFRGSALQVAMVMALGATIAIWGVYSIRSLRLEAFEAKKMGQYQLRKLLGSGGMGEVYLAEHLMLKRPCALKMIRPEIAGVSQNLVRFEREVQATARLTHWNTVEIYDYGSSDDGTFYYVMEYLPGLNLEEIVRMHGRMPAERVVHLLAQVCDALAEAHCQGLIHRDIKPANVFAARRGGRYDVAKLLDFGLVRQTELAEDASLTRDGSITGSPLYMSPEQAIGEQPDRRSDIYSLGAVAYFLLTGQPPFEDENPMRVMMAHARDAPTAPGDLNSDITPDIEKVVMKCLSKDPDERYETVNLLRRDLMLCDAANSWDEDQSAAWWRDFGCPDKKKLDAEVLELTTA